LKTFGNQILDQLSFGPDSGFHARTKTKINQKSKSANIGVDGEKKKEQENKEDIH
jgi:hypothetical protein